MKLYSEFQNYHDEDDYQIGQADYDYYTEDFTELMKQVAKRFKYFGYWLVKVSGFGWRNTSGHTTLHNIEDGATLLEKILPNCLWNIRVYRDGSQIKINCTHHDSPTWNKEWYTITPLNAKDVEAFNGW
jgi:hypothetical protein